MYARVDDVGQMAGWLPHGNRGESQRILDMFIREIGYEGRSVEAILYNPKITIQNETRCHD